MNNYTIDWVRHGESCSNLLADSNRDRRINESYQPSFYNVYKDYNVPSLDIMKQDEIIKYIEMIKIPKYIMMADTSNIHSRSGWDIFLSRLTNIPNLFKSVLNEPPLTFIGICHSINFGRNYIRKNNMKYDIHITSGLSRTIMTGLMSMRGLNGIVLKVVPYINEITPISFVDYQNVAVEAKILKKRIHFIIDWFKKNWLKYYDDIEIIEDLMSIFHKLNPINRYLVTYYINYISMKDRDMDKIKYNLKFILNSIITSEIKLIDFIKKYDGKDNSILVCTETEFYVKMPSVDFSIYREYEKSIGDIYISDYTEFYNTVVPRIISMNQNKNNMKIIAFSHGKFIRNISEMVGEIIIPPLMNTGLVRQINNKFNMIDYIPIKLRALFNTDLEDNNMNACSVDHLMGICNHDMKVEDSNMNRDIKFAKIKDPITNKSEYQKEIDDDIIKRKYMKYKLKYLELQKKF